MYARTTTVRGDPRAAMTAGMGLVPEDRRQQGLVMELSIERNATMTQMGGLSRFGLLSSRAERARPPSPPSELSLRALEGAYSAYSSMAPPIRRRCCRKL